MVHIFSETIIFVFGIRQMQTKKKSNQKEVWKNRGKHMRAVSVKAKTQNGHKFSMNVCVFVCRCACLTDIVTQ